MSAFSRSRFRLVSLTLNFSKIGENTRLQNLEYGVDFTLLTPLVFFQEALLDAVHILQRFSLLLDNL